MAGNPFDQFDAQPSGGNPFDQFDTGAAADKQTQQVASIGKITPKQAAWQLQQAKASLRHQIENLPANAQQIGWQKFAADPRIQALTQRARQGPTSTWEGFIQGTQKPIMNTATWLEKGMDALGIRQPIVNAANAIEHGLNRMVGWQDQPTANTVAQAQQNVATRNALSPVAPSGVGRFVGEMAGTAPAMLVPGGALAQGATMGAMLADNPNDLGGVATGAALGAAGGKIGETAANAFGRAVGPRVSNAMSQLAGKVRMTPGQVARTGSGPLARMAAGLEDRMSSLPGPTGTRVIAGREAAASDFMRGAINDSLGEIGQQLPDNVPAGHAAVKYLQKAAGKAYDNALSAMKLVPDQTLEDELVPMVENARNGGVSEPMFKEFQKFVSNSVLRRAQGGELSGDALKTTLSEINAKARNYSSSSDASQRELGALFNNLADILERGAMRSSPPEAGQALKAADRAYAKAVRIEGAAKNAKGGIFSPGQLMTAIRQADSSVRKRAVAAGEGLMQPYAAAGQELLPSRIGTSGTSERQGLFNPLAWATDLATYYPYRAAEKIAPSVAQMANRPGNAMLMQLAKPLEPALQIPASAFAAQLPNDRRQQ